MRNVIIVGGGLAGLISGIQLAGAGVPCRIFEKKAYPFHRVCGEYVSNEATSFLTRSGLFPHDFSPPRITRFQLSSTAGKQAVLDLDLGGFGISRYTFDHFLYKKALERGVEFYLDTEVNGIAFDAERFTVSTSDRAFQADAVIAAFGKRAKLDSSIRPAIARRRSPYAAVKYHVRTDHPQDVIALHNFPGGYCGISNVESGVANLCYLAHRSLLRRTRSIPALETEVIFKNPLLRYIFDNSDFLLPKPEVINEVSFEGKSAVEDHVLFAGDAAGTIAPLCGNGMAMAIHSGKILGELVAQFCLNRISREQLERAYELEWKKNFARRLWVGRQAQRLFGNQLASNMAVNLMLFFRPIANGIVQNTHGSVF